jgi:hypothetical protein
MLDINLFREGATINQRNIPVDRFVCSLPKLAATLAHFQCIDPQKKGAIQRKSESLNAEDIQTEMTKRTRWP